ncbi:flagellar export protein FliJ [bacterium]|nr:flagellar export protein FliJ [bacterium]MBU1152787.1 flagellar export protein FliJ [bacterium]
MPRFRFRLQRLLEVRKHFEELLISELAVSKRRYLNEEEVLNSLKELVGVNLKRLKKKQERITSVEEIILSYHYLHQLDHQIIIQKESLKKIQEEINLITEKLIKASQKKKVVEKLKERRLNEHKKLLEKIEQGVLDEVGINLYLRRKR